MRPTLPITLPHPSDGTEGQTFRPCAVQYSYRSVKVTPGSTTAYANFSLTSMILFMRWRSRAKDPGSLGAGPPYPMFLPLEKVHTGMAYLFATWRTA